MKRLLKRTFLQYYGTLLTVAAIATTEVLNQRGVFARSDAEVYLSLIAYTRLAFVALVFAAYVNGLRAAFASAIAIGLYAFYIFPGEFHLNAMTFLAALCIAGMAGHLKRVARKWDTLNGSKQKAVNAAAIVNLLLDEFNTMPSSTMKLHLQTLQDLTGNLANSLVMPIQLKQEIEEAIELAKKEVELKRQLKEADDQIPPAPPANVTRLE